LAGIWRTDAGRAQQPQNGFGRLLNFQSEFMRWFTEIFNVLPLWTVFLLTLAIGVAQVEFGSVFARLLLNKSKEPEGPLGAMVGSLFGLLAFMLAFTFGVAATRFDTRRQLMLDEAAAVRTAYLRADLLPAAQATSVKRLLAEYLDARIHLDPKNVEAVLKQSVDLHRQLWEQAKSLVPESMDGELRALFVESLNEVIELHQRRVTLGMHYQVPGTVWVALYVLSGLTMLSVGYQVGMSGARRLRWTPIAAAGFAVVVLMIADIDRPGEGFIMVSPQPLIDVRQTMNL
jgi:hypothetical protein